MAYTPSGVQGSTLEMKQASGITVYTTIKGVRNVREVSGGRAEIDITAIDDSSQQLLVGFAKPGTMSFELVYDEAENTHAALEAAYYDNGATSQQVDLRYTASDRGTASKREYVGCRVKKFEVTAQTEAAWIANVELAISNEVTRTAGS